MTPEAWKASGRMHHVGGFDLFVQVAGSPEHPSILFMHGFPTSGWDWHRIAPALAERYYCMMPDMLGFGFSAKPRRHRYSIMEQADLMEAIAADLCGSRYHLLAHDYGDTVAQEMLARDQDRPADQRRILSVCFLNGGLFPETHRARLIQKLLASPLGPLLSSVLGAKQFARSFSAVFGPDTKPHEPELAHYWQCITYNKGRMVFHKLIGYMAERRIHRQRWLDALVHAPCPVCLINGSADPVSGAHMVARYRELVLRADKICQMPRIGHYPQMEAPDEVSAAYLDFLHQEEASP